MKNKREIAVSRTAMTGRMAKGLAAFLMALALVFGFASCKTESEEETVYRTVTYSTEHATAPEKLTVTDGTALTAEQLPALTESGYTFGGWYDGETKAEAGQYRVTKTVTLTAKWTASGTSGSDPQNPDTPTTPDGGNTGETATYTVTVESGIANGTVIASPTTAAAGTEITLTVTPSTGYQLTTLTVTDADSKEVTVTNNKFTMPKSNVTVSATFTTLPPGSASYTVKHLQQNIADDSYTLKESETKTGKVGEATSASAKSYDGFTAQDFSQATIAESGTEVEIKYKRKAYTVTFNSDGGSDVPSQTVRYGATATKPADPTKAATDTVTYTFSGWYNGNTVFDFSTAITADITLTAKWTESAKKSSVNGNGITVVFPPESDLKLTKSENGSSYTVPDGYSVPEWKISGESVQSYSDEGFALSNDGKTLTITADSLTASYVYDVYVTATKDGKTYAVSFQVKK